MKRRVLALIVAAGVAVTLGGCGSEQGIGETASAALTPQVQAVRAAAEKGNRDEALTKLAGLRHTVAQVRTTGDMSDQGAATVLEAAADVERQLALLPGAPSGDNRAPATTSVGGKDETQRKAEEDARKRAEEAAKKAEEEAKKRAEDARKRAEEGKKD